MNVGGPVQRVQTTLNRPRKANCWSRSFQQWRPHRRGCDCLSIPVFPNHFRLAAPYTRQTQFAAPSGEPIAIYFKVWWHFESGIFNDIVKNAVARSTPEYRKWHPAVPRHSGLEPLVYPIDVIETMKRAGDITHPCRSQKLTVNGCGWTPLTRCQEKLPLFPTCIEATQRWSLSFSTVQEN